MKKLALALAILAAAAPAAAQVSQPGPTPGTIKYCYITPLGIVCISPPKR